MKETVIVVKRLVNGSTCEISIPELRKRAFVPVSTFAGLAHPDIKHNCRVADDFPEGIDMRIEVTESLVEEYRSVTRKEALQLLVKHARYLHAELPRTEYSLSSSPSFDYIEDIDTVYNPAAKTALVAMISKMLPKPANPPKWLDVEIALEELARTKTPMLQRITICNSPQSSEMAERIFCQEASVGWPGVTRHCIYLVEEEAWPAIAKKISGEMKKNSNCKVIGFSFKRSKTNTT